MIKTEFNGIETLSVVSDVIQFSKGGDPRPVAANGSPSGHELTLVGDQAAGVCRPKYRN